VPVLPVASQPPLALWGCRRAIFHFLDTAANWTLWKTGISTLPKKRADRPLHKEVAWVTGNGQRASGAVIALLDVL